MVLQLPGGKKGERQLRRILQPVKDRAIDEGLSEIPDASQVIAKLKKDIMSLKRKVKTLESRTGKLWAGRVREDIRNSQNAEARNGR